MKKLLQKLKDITADPRIFLSGYRYSRFHVMDSQPMVTMLQLNRKKNICRQKLFCLSKQSKAGSAIYPKSDRALEEWARESGPLDQSGRSAGYHCSSQNPEAHPHPNLSGGCHHDKWQVLASFFSATNLLDKFQLCIPTGPPSRGNY